MCISVFSSTPKRAAVDVFAFFAGMVSAYYMYSEFIAGFFPLHYAMIWAALTAVSPFLAYICWYAKGTGRPVPLEKYRKAIASYAGAGCFDAYGIAIRYAVWLLN